MVRDASVRQEVEAIRARLQARRPESDAVEKTARGAARGHVRDRDLSHGLAVARALWRSSREDEQRLAILYLSHFHRQFEPGHWKEFKAWVGRARKPEHIDLIATKLLGNLVLKDRTWCRVLRHWALSRDERERRAAAMALVPRTRQMGDAEAALALAEGLMRDRSPLVREALDLLLREADAADPSLARDFLSRWKR
jgi:3-methyladenine DNA glycosylase AlkD